MPLIIHLDIMSFVEIFEWIHPSNLLSTEWSTHQIHVSNWDDVMHEWSLLLPFDFKCPSKPGRTISSLSLNIQRARLVIMQKGCTWDSSWSQWDGTCLSLCVLKPTQITGTGVESPATRDTSLETMIRLSAWAGVCVYANTGVMGKAAQSQLWLLAVPWLTKQIQSKPTMKDSNLWIDMRQTYPAFWVWFCLIFLQTEGHSQHNYTENHLSSSRIRVAREAPESYTIILSLCKRLIFLQEDLKPQVLCRLWCRDVSWEYTEGCFNSRVQNILNLAVPREVLLQKTI